LHLLTRIAVGETWICDAVLSARTGHMAWAVLWSFAPGASRRPLAAAIELILT
jgi:hypothetical protein